ncbi:hypothetical protein C8J57DRAFT_227663 [Mycena rebaudengoi]|nr:hypothetical protein C8J57DRAFT_227663 [Mycena rebaudengoi]
MSLLAAATSSLLNCVRAPRRLLLPAARRASCTPPATLRLFSLLPPPPTCRRRRCTSTRLPPRCLALPIRQKNEHRYSYSYIAVVTPSPTSTLRHSPDSDTISISAAWQRGVVQVTLPYCISSVRGLPSTARSGPYFHPHARHGFAVPCNRDTAGKFQVLDHRLELHSTGCRQQGSMRASKSRRRWYSNARCPRGRRGGVGVCRELGVFVNERCCGSRSLCIPDREYTCT